MACQSSLALLLLSISSGAWTASALAESSDGSGLACELRFQALTAPSVRASLALVFSQAAPPRSQAKAAAKELARLDELLATELSDDLRDLTADRRARLLKVIESAGKAPHFDPEGGGLAQYNWGTVKLPSNGPLRLLIQQRILNHPLGRAIFRHEFDHLSRLDIGEAAQGEAHRNWEQMRREHWNWSEKDEASAFGKEYDFIQKAYQGQDLERLAKVFPFRPSVTRERLLKAKGLLQENPDGTIVIRYDDEVMARLEQDPKLREAFFHVLYTDLNWAYYSHIKRVLATSREDFVRMSLAQPDYQEHFREGRLIWLGHQTQQMAIGATVGGGAYFLFSRQR